MKKQLIVIFVLICCFFLNGCNASNPFFFESNSNNVNQKEEVNEILGTLLIALENKDEEAIKNLMAPKLAANSETLNTEIQNAFDFFEGKIISYKNIETTSEGERHDNGKLIYLRIGNAITNEIITDTNIYSISFSAVLINEKNTDQEGIWRIWIGNDDEESVVIGSDDYDL